MKSATFMLAAAAMLAAGCNHIDRSRDLANPQVSATTLAQQVCSNCHGIAGSAVSPNFPNLAAQVEPYFVAQLKGFRSHNRQDPAGFEYMWGPARVKVVVASFMRPVAA
jgi:cytochrome c553